MACPPPTFPRGAGGIATVDDILGRCPPQSPLAMEEFDVPWPSDTTQLLVHANPEKEAAEVAEGGSPMEHLMVVQQQKITVG